MSDTRNGLSIVANAAAYADRAVILSDGRIVDDFLAPDADRVLAAMKALGA